MSVNKRYCARKEPDHQQRYQDRTRFRKITRIKLDLEILPGQNWIQKDYQDIIVFRKITMIELDLKRLPGQNWIYGYLWVKSNESCTEKNEFGDIPKD